MLEMGGTVYRYYHIYNYVACWARTWHNLYKSWVNIRNHNSFLWPFQRVNSKVISLKLQLEMHEAYHISTIKCCSYYILISSCDILFKDGHYSEQRLLKLSMNWQNVLRK